MQNSVCCVCGRQVGDAAARLGRRAYCEEHFAKVSRNRGSAWRSSLAYILALLIFTALVAVLADLAEPSLDGTALVLAGVGLALITAWLWLGFFYIQDTLEPEPKSYVLGVFALGALLATAVGIPILRDLFRVQDWLGFDALSTVLGSILVVGFVQEFLKYAAVRYSVYPTAEFDERMDGILYGTASGLGYATALNIAYVVSSGGVDLAMGCIRIVVTALAQASFSGISGYFLARAKFEDKPIWWLPLGLSIAAVLNGLFVVLWGSVARSDSLMSQTTAGPWLGLALAAGFAVSTLVVVLVLMRRVNRLEADAGTSRSSL